MEEEIKPRYTHGKYGMFMFRLTAKWTKFIVKHRFLYYFLACTWGLFLTLVGWFITLGFAVAKIFDHKITFKKYNWVYSISTGPDWWGGFEMGLMFVRDHKSWTSLDAHEFGHTFQNCLFGPMQVFFVGIPSMCRYWYQMIREKKGLDNKPYDLMWFEDSASCCGEYAAKYLNRSEVKSK